jgi:hypothetical protein
VSIDERKLVKRFRDFENEYIMPEMGWYCKGKDISEMMHSAIRGHLECPEPDAILNIETHLFNTVLTADSCDYSLDLGKDVWLNRQRWSRLIKEYVPLEPTNRFVDQAVEILNGEARCGATANMMFRDPDRYAKKHRWGGCIMGATFRGDNQKAGRATLTFYSRTTYIGYMGLLDAAIANVMAREICERFNAAGAKSTGHPIDERDIAFRWHLSSQQFHAFKSLPYVYSQPDLMARLEKYAKQRRTIPDAPPTWKFMAKWYCKVLDGWKAWGNPNDAQGWLDTEKYGPFRRIKRRWCEYKGYLAKHLPPSCPVSTLDFEKAV